FWLKRSKYLRQLFISRRALSVIPQRFQQEASDSACSQVPKEGLAHSVCDYAHQMTGVCANCSRILAHSICGIEFLPSSVTYGALRNDSDFGANTHPTKLNAT